MIKSFFNFKKPYLLRFFVFLMLLFRFKAIGFTIFLYYLKCKKTVLLRSTNKLTLIIRS